MLLQDTRVEHLETLNLIEAFEKTFLFEGQEDYFSGLIPRDSPVVLAHNDAQENNVLINLDNNEDMMLIDFEYGGWNPMAYDIANYFNECICENEQLKSYQQNYPLKDERE